MVGNPVLGFLEAQPVGDDARSTVTKMLRWLGIVLLASFAVSVINAILTMAMVDYIGGNAGMGMVIGVLVFGTIITGLALFWITYTIKAWSTGQANGGTHALIIGILATVFGGLGALALLGGTGGGLYGAEVSMMRTIVGALTGILSVLELVCGIMILVNRGKAINTTTTGTPTRN